MAEAPAGRTAGPDGDALQERQRRWRLLLGAPADESLEGGRLSATDQAMDGALAALYDAPDPGPGDGAPRQRSAGLAGSAPRVARWLGDIKNYFPAGVVQVMQKDAITRLDLTSLLTEPELLDSLEPDVHLVGTLLSLNRVMPETAKAGARRVVAGVVAEIERRIADATRSSVSGALDRSSRTSRPRPGDVDWNRTIAANLSHYLPEYRTVVPERLVGHARRRQSVERDVVLAVDQSGSMAESVVYASVFAAVLASIRSLKTSLVVFDTSVVDLTEYLDDPVDVLFGTQLGGGTDINRAVAYCQTLIERPGRTLFVLISDLVEGGARGQLLSRVAAMLSDGVQVLVLLALSDEGAPAFDTETAGALAALGVPAFACSPDAFPGLLAVALQRGDLESWRAREAAARRGL
jgi:Mg-chelatase subunit ChlD